MNSRKGITLKKNKKYGVLSLSPLLASIDIPLELKGTIKEIRSKAIIASIKRKGGQKYDIKVITKSEILCFVVKNFVVSSIEDLIGLENIIIIVKNKGEYISKKGRIIVSKDHVIANDKKGSSLIVPIEIASTTMSASKKETDK